MLEFVAESDEKLVLVKVVVDDELLAFGEVRGVVAFYPLVHVTRADVRLVRRAALRQIS